VLAPQPTLEPLDEESHEQPRVPYVVQQRQNTDGCFAMLLVRRPPAIGYTALMVTLTGWAYAAIQLPKLRTLIPAALLAGFIAGCGRPPLLLGRGRGEALASSGGALEEDDTQRRSRA
jgi:hypothetical protein